MRYRIVTVSLIVIVITTVFQISLVSATSIVEWKADSNAWSQVEGAEGQKQNTMGQVLQTSTATVQPANPNASDDVEKKHFIFLPLLQRPTFHPANPNANADARKLLNWLVGLPQRPDKRVISGQQVCCGWDFKAAYDTYVTDLYKETGKWIALLGADYAYGIWSDPGQNSTLIEHWNNGGLITLNWTAWNPWTGNGLEWTGGGSSDRNIGDLADLYTPGNDAYDMWHADMDRKAGWLDELQDAGVVVLWRPFHEMNGCWMWWCCRDQAEFINLWRHMFDYFTYEKGLNNLLWVYAPNRLPCSYAPEYYYPGDDYVDIVGLDYYLDTGGLDLIDERGRPELLALGKPMALTEFGPTGWYVGDDPPEHIPSINSYDYGSLMDKIQELCPEVVYFLSWGENYSLINQLGAQGLLNDPWVITRDEVDWRSEPTPTPSPTPTPTSTPTPTPTQTLLPTYTPTVTNTPTSLPTSTPTFAPTNTPRPTNTPLPTNTPTLTPTSTKPTPT
ncbi:MAG: hypothetical protein GTN71_21280 [Anaerolineae bacterium]|nr:hypothetical protein [Anaerolineae bacterium]